MSEWLDLMLEEVARKEREAKEAREERERRDGEQPQKTPDKTPSDQSK